VLNHYKIVQQLGRKSDYDEQHVEQNIEQNWSERKDLLERKIGEKKQSIHRFCGI